MQLSIDQLAVEITTEACDLPPDERARLQPSFAALADAAEDLPDSVLNIDIVYHAKTELYSVKARLTLPRRSISTGDKNGYLDTALQRCLRKLLHKVEHYKEHADPEAIAAAERREALERYVIAPDAPDTGPLAEAVEAGDYREFRFGLGDYEDWLRKRIGRLIQRFPDAQSRLGGEILLGDVIEEVYLNAFEQFTRRSTAIPLSKWLEGLIVPSLQALVRHPAEEAEVASMARTWRNTSLE